MQTHVPEFDMVIFGGTGDLAMRKLLPALYHRHCDGVLPAQGRIIATARNGLSREEYLALVEKNVESYVPRAKRDTQQWQSFLQRLHYVSVNAAEADSFARLAQQFDAVQERVRVFYLATSPALFGAICEQLSHHQLIHENSRVVLEKPLGHDLASSREINQVVGRYFQEKQIFRIDHYLGKETVQNLLVLRFGNTMFESLWNQKYIDHVQITVAESIGVEGRAGFYDDAGALRDMVQNHLMQLLCFVAMEPPASLDADSVRDEKLKVLRSLKPLTEQSVRERVVRGQYNAGAVSGVAVPAYRQEPGVKAESRTETFVALKAEIENWRWGNVPFYLRTGKRMPSRVSDIVVQFKTVPHSIFDTQGKSLSPNKLIIRIQPEEDITLTLCGKRPGSGVNVRDVSLNLAEATGSNLPDAYERLLIDSIVGRQTLFMRRDELDAAWQWVMPILDTWKKDGDKPESYFAGSWGPTSAMMMLARDGREWYPDVD